MKKPDHLLTKCQGLHGFQQFLLRQVKETNGIYQHGPDSLGLHSKHTLILISNGRKSIQKALTFHQILPLKS